MSALLTATDWRVVERDNDGSLFIEAGGGKADYHIAFDIALMPEDKAIAEKMCLAMNNHNKHTRRRCIDCKNCDELYMIHDELWYSLGLKFKDLCCLQCVQVRLGRKLTPDDFTTASCNSGWVALLRS